ncbi:MAG: maleylpyruvate isomerase N-terminal domain-containing protein [Streptosporangiaceae bacterium]
MVAHLLDRQRVLASYLDGIAVISELSRGFAAADWKAPTPCTEWLASDLVAHLRCVADDYHELLDDGPGNRLARLMAPTPPPDKLARHLARQNAAELAALPSVEPPAHVWAFVRSARRHARRLPTVWDEPCFTYGGRSCTVGDHAGVACIEWHVHAWDLAYAIGKSYRPADPEALASSWRSGMPHLPIGDGDPWLAVLTASGRAAVRTAKGTGV